MKKFVNVLLAFCFIFFEIVTFLNYSEKVYSSIYSDKDSLFIDMRNGQTTEEFVSDLDRLSRENAIPIFYTNVLNGSSSKPIFNLYTTSFDSNFLRVKSTASSTVGITDYLTTDSSDSNATGYIFGANLTYNVNIYRFDLIRNFDINHGKFYTSSDSLDKFLSVLVDNQYNVALSEPDSFDASDAMFELQLMLFLVTCFFLFSSFCYAFSKSREVVVKKTNGFGELDVFLSTFSSKILLILINSVLSFCISILVFWHYYPYSIADYAGFQLQPLLFYTLICMLLYTISCVYIQFMKSANEIRGNRPDRLLYVASLLIRIVVCVIVLWGTSCAVDSIFYTHNLIECEQNISYMDNDYVTLSLNALSVDLYGQTDEYMEKAKNLIKDLEENEKAIIVDSQDFFEADEIDDHSFLYVNKNYFSVNPIELTSGIKIEDLQFDDKLYNILIPTGFESEHLELDESSVKVYQYISGQDFHTFNTYSGVYNGGIIRNPIIVILNDEMLSWKAESIIGEHFLLVPRSSQNAYSDLLRYIESNGMSSVIREAPSLKELFDTIIVESRIKETQYIIMSILYISVEIMVTIFETVVYYHNNRRSLAIMKVHGFGGYTYSFPLLTKLIAAVILTCFAFLNRYHVSLAALAIIIDSITFLVCIHHVEHDSILTYLKEDN